MFTTRSRKRSPASPCEPLERAAGRLRALVDARLAALIPPDGEGDVARAMHAAACSSGKRLRPILLLLIIEAHGRRAALGLDLACVVELVHASSLVLDDLPCMDDSPLRRGEAAVHTVYGEATAVLTAFALLARAHGLLPDALARAGVAPPHRAPLQQRLSEVVEAMTRGQDLDLRLPGSTPDVELLEAIHAQKTGALFELAAELGAAAAGADRRTAGCLLAFARNLGLAFQVSDDLLDAAGSPAVLGKPAGRDASLGRTTFVSVLGVDPSRALLAELLGTASAALAPLGDRARLLADLADYVRTRTS